MAGLAYYLHDLSPFALRFTDTLGIRWYGLAYLSGFVAVYFLMKRFARQGLCDLKESEVADFVTFCAIGGVMVGGRLGYMLLYDWPRFSHNPLIFFEIMGGGMASHGGIAGLMLAIGIFAVYKGYSWTNLGDNLTVGAPVGLFFGRLANFINGELFGRPSTVAWAVRFPAEIHHETFYPASGSSSDAEILYEQFNPLIFSESGSHRVPIESSQAILHLAQQNPELMQVLERSLNPRHPSQIYEALLEGAFLFLVLYLMRTRIKNLHNGILTGTFFLLYALVRIFGEMFREPDSGITKIMGLSRGQFYSTFMIAIGLAFLIWGTIWGKRKVTAGR